MRDVDIANIPKNRVPQFTYFYVREDDDKIIGMTAVRPSLNEHIPKESGNIGYCIRPSERKKGYGTKMLREALAFCPKVGLYNVTIMCDKANTASAGVIKNCGGVLENEFHSETFGMTVQQYGIILNPS